MGEEHVAEGRKERPEVVWKHLSHTEKDGCETTHSQDCIIIKKKQTIPIWQEKSIIH